MSLNYFFSFWRDWPPRFLPWLMIFGFSIGLVACQLPEVEQVVAWVPPTAEQDPALPQLPITVAGYQRILHLQTFGDPSKPVAFVLPGGAGADFRLLLPLRDLSDRYFVVMWASRSDHRCTGAAD